MDSGYLLIRLFLLLSMTVSCTKGAKICVMKYELESYDDRMVDYAQAERICQSSGRYLAKINTGQMTGTLFNVLRKQEYYIGLKLISDGDYKWHDGDRIGAYQNWASGHGQECVVADGANRGKWISFPCSYEAYFVCQRTLMPSVSIVPTSLAVEDDTGEISCFTWVNSICSTTVTWFDPNGNVIPTSQNSDVYQNKSSTTTQLISKLVLTNANKSHEGSYVCKVQIGTGIASSTADVSISAKPIINDIVLSNCSSPMNISWTSNVEVRGYSHLLKVFPTANRTEMTQLKFNASDTYNATLNDLKSATEYSIEISVCKTDACSHRNPSVQIITTEGIPLAVPSATISTIGSNCSVIWNPPFNKWNNIARYKVRIAKHTVESRSPTVHITDSYEVTNATYVFDALPNMKYFAEIQAVNCAGTGAIVTAAGSCTGASQAPDNIEKPIITYCNGETNITTKIPEETNGLISCLFVIVLHEKTSETSLEEYNLKDLINANETSGRDEYIAVAIPYFRFPESKRMTVLLGDGSTSQCDLYKNIDRDYVNYAYNLTLMGKNKPLLFRKTFRVYIVAAVPYGGKLNLRRSQDAVWDPESKKPVVTLSSDCGYMVADHVCEYAALRIQWVKSTHFLGMIYKLIVLDTSSNATKETNVKFVLAEEPVINITETKSRPGLCNIKSKLNNSEWETVVDLRVGHTKTGKLASVAIVQHLQPPPGYKLTIFNVD